MEKIKDCPVKVGDTIWIQNMKGESQYQNLTGRVTSIDDAGQIHGTWGGCALIPGVDEFEVTAAAAEDGIEERPIVKIVIQHGKIYEAFGTDKNILVEIVNLDTDDPDEAGALCNIMEHLVHEWEPLEISGKD